jgi:membrane-bound lytic murein transglycosylase D
MMLLWETSGNNYFDLYLSLETMRYVYKIIAAKAILSNPGKYGFDFPEAYYYKKVEGKVYTTTIIKREIPLNLIAESAGITFKTLKELNPELRGFFLKKGRYDILLPDEKAIAELKKNYDKNLKSWYQNIKNNIYTVSKGDNLTTIAKKYDLPVNILLIVNHLTTKSILKIGQKIIIPVR